MYKFCDKCGNITLGNKYLEEKCWICGNTIIPVPTKYIKENEILTDTEIENRSIELIEELVKPSPEFDQYFFEHRDEILSKKSAELNAKMEHGKSIIEERSRVPKCIYCGSTTIRKIGLLNRAISTELWGLGSKKIGKQFHCNHCGADF